jgi:hypothetical protein
MIKMPTFIELDSSVREENPTIILGKNIVLKIIEDSDKQGLLRNNTVKRFVSIPNLFNNEMRRLIDSLLEQEAYLTAPSFLQMLMQGKDRLEALAPHLQWLEQILAPLMESKMLKVIKESTQGAITEDEFEKLSKQRPDLVADFMFRVKGQINKEQRLEYERKLLSIDKEIEKKTGFRITVPSVLFVCPKCKKLLFSNEIANKKCLSCNKAINEERIGRIPISKIPDEIKILWQSNLWFEAYFANLLRKLDFQTWVGVHAMGASGILHEVDVLAIRRGAVVVSECKTGKVARNDVFNFCTKMSDLKVHVSILALIKELPEPETREFVKRNPAIIRLENMGQKKEEEILAELDQRLSLKT